MYVSALTAEGEIAADQVADGVSKSGRVLRSSYWVCFWCLCQSGHLVLVSICQETEKSSDDASTCSSFQVFSRELAV